MKIDLTNEEILRVLIRDWETSPGHHLQLIGKRYYYGDHDIRHPESINGKYRYTLIEGQRYPIPGAVNNIIVDNIYTQMVQQKVNYLFSKPLLVSGDQQEAKDLLRPLFGRTFLATMKKLATEFVNCGIAYLHPYYTTDGEFDLAVFSGAEVIPIWGDYAHKHLEGAIRVYTTQIPTVDAMETHKYATVFLKDFTRTYELKEDKVILMMEEPYVVQENPESHFTWGKIPLIPFKLNSEEIPLIQRCKTLQDSLNYLESTYLDVLEETGDTTLLAISGGGAENPLELRKNIIEHRLMYLQNVPGIDAKVQPVQMDVKKENYELIINMLRRSLVENCNGFEMKDERILGTHINEMNIKSMYVALDLDANNIETEFQYSIYQLLYFFNKHFEAHGKPTVDIEKITILTDRDMIINVEAQVNMFAQLIGKVSTPTAVSVLSEVDNVEEEIQRMKEEGLYPPPVSKEPNSNPAPKKSSTS